MLPLLRHIAFFEAIAEHADEADPQWVESVSGMLVLRFFEEWLDSPALACMNQSGVARMQQMIDEIANPEIRYLLSTAVSVLIQGEGNPSVVAGPLLAYARYLEEVGRYKLSEDVFKTVLETIDSIEGFVDPRLAATTYFRLGFLVLRDQRFDDAEAIYERMFSLAQMVDDLALSLEAQIAQAMVCQVRGNLGDAESTLTTLVNQAQAAGLQRVEAWGRRVRGSGMLRQGRYGDALRDLYTGYTVALDEPERELLLADIAGSAAGLGLWHTARLTYSALARTAYSDITRSYALVNLLEIAIWDEDQVTFHALWRELLGRKLPQDAEVFSQLLYARSIEQWKDAQAAIDAYTTVAKHAEQVGVHQLEFQALEALKRLQGQLTELSSSIPLRASEIVSTEWEDVTEAIEAACKSRLQAAESIG